MFYNSLFENLLKILPIFLFLIFVTPVVLVLFSLFYEYSIKRNITPSKIIAKFGTNFKTDETYASEFGKFNAEAVRLMDRAGWR